MADRVRLSHVEERFEELSYPVSRSEAADRYGGTTLVLADDEEDLGELIGSLSAEEFTSADDLYSELQNALPVGAVGEPEQSEGEG